MYIRNVLPTYMYDLGLRPATLECVIFTLKLVSIRIIGYDGYIVVYASSISRILLQQVMLHQIHSNLFRLREYMKITLKLHYTRRFNTLILIDNYMVWP